MSPQATVPSHRAFIIGSSSIINWKEVSIDSIGVVSDAAAVAADILYLDLEGLGRLGRLDIELVCWLN
jgi:hypothetical protein